MKSITFNFRFKGDRNYIHGTDMYDSITSYLSKNGYESVRDINMSIHKMAKTNLDGWLADHMEEVSGYSPVTDFVFVAGDQKKKIILVENDQPVKERYPYPEHEIIALSEISIENKTITLEREINYTNIEKTVALNKAVHENVYTDITGKWYFTRLQITRDLNTYTPGSIEIRIVKNMNFRLTRSEIYYDDQKIGSIYFSLVK